MHYHFNPTNAESTKLKTKDAATVASDVTELTEAHTNK